jgi:hypothetical protein
MGFDVSKYTFVKDRLVEYRNTYEGCSIKTELISVNSIVDSKTGDMCNEYVIQATITPNPLQEPEICFTGLAAERDNGTFINKTSAMENCETSAVGRALAFAGFGGDMAFASAEEVVNAQLNQKTSAVTVDLLDVLDGMFNIAKQHMPEDHISTHIERRGADYYDTKVKWKKAMAHFMGVIKQEQLIIQNAKAQKTKSKPKTVKKESK